MTTSACPVIDLERYREQRRLSFHVRPSAPPSVGADLDCSFASARSPGPDLQETLAALGRELRNAELRLIDLAATIDELYAQVDDMARR